MNPTPSICVVVVAHNPGPYFSDCVQSILAQTLAPQQIILVDNGCTDGTSALCNKLARQHPEIEVVHRDNLGASRGRAAGLAWCREKFVCFVDGDDLLHPQMLQWLWQACQQTGADVSVCGLQSFSDTPPAPAPCEPSVAVLFHPHHLRGLLLDKRVEYSMCNKLYRCALLSELPWDSPIVYNEDLYLNWALFQKLSHVAVVEQAGYWYRQHPQSTSHRPLNHAMLQDQKPVADAIYQQGQAPDTAQFVGAFYLEKLLYLDSMILRQRQPAPFKESHRDFVQTIRRQIKEQRRNPQLSFALKAIALMAGYLPGVYHVVCRLVLRDRQN